MSKIKENYITSQYRRDQVYIQVGQKTDNWHKLNNSSKLKVDCNNSLVSKYVSY